MQTSVSSVDSLLAAGPPAAASYNDVGRAEMGRPFRQIVEDASTRKTEAKTQPDNVSSADEVRAKEPDKDRGRLESPASDQAGRPRSPVHDEKAPETQERDESAVPVSSEQAQTGRLGPAGAPSMSRRTSQAAPSAVPSAAEQPSDHTRTQPIPADGPVDTAQPELGGRARTSAKPQLVVSADSPGGWKGPIGADGEPRLDKHVESGGGRGPIQAPTGPAQKDPDAVARSSPNAAGQNNPDAIGQKSGQKQGAANLARPGDTSPGAARQEGVLQQTVPQKPQEPGQGDTVGTGKDANARLSVPSQRSASTRVDTQQPDNKQHLRPETSPVVPEQSQDGQNKLVSMVGPRDAPNSPTQGIAASHDVPRTGLDQLSQSAGSGQVPPAVIGRESSRIIGEQIMESLSASIQRGQDNILIRLNPPELGRVWVTLQQQQGQVVGLLEADRGETRRQIEQVLPEIVRSLEDSGIQVRRLDVSHGDGGERQTAKDGLESQDWTQQRAFSQDDSRRASHSAQTSAPPPGPTVASSEPQVEAATEGLNMLI